MTTPAVADIDSSVPCVTSGPLRAPERHALWGFPPGGEETKPYRDGEANISRQEMAEPGLDPTLPNSQSTLLAAEGLADIGNHESVESSRLGELL